METRERMFPFFWFPGLVEDVEDEIMQCGFLGLVEDVEDEIMQCGFLLCAPNTYDQLLWMLLPTKLNSTTILLFSFQFKLFVSLIRFGYSS